MITGKMVYEALLEELGATSSNFIRNWDDSEKDFTSVQVDGDVNCEAISDYLNKQEPTKDFEEYWQRYIDREWPQKDFTTGALQLRRPAITSLEIAQDAWNAALLSAAGGGAKVSK